MKTTLIINTDELNDYKVDTELSFNLALGLINKRLPIGAGDYLLQPMKLMSVDVTRNNITFYAQVIEKSCK